MTGSLVRPVYRVLTGLYPEEFRKEYRDDLVALFDEMLADRGVVLTTMRSAIDLTVTVPLYRLEAVMHDARATQALPFAIAALLALGVSGPLIGLPWVGAVLFLAGIVLGVSNRSRLARAIRTPDSSRRAHRLRMAAISMGVFAAAVAVYLVAISDGSVSTLGLLLPSVVGNVALATSLAYFVAGLLTPSSKELPRP